MYSTQITTSDGFSPTGARVNSNGAQCALYDASASGAPLSPEGDSDVPGEAEPIRRDYSLGPIAVDVRERLVGVLMDQQDAIVAQWGDALRHIVNSPYATLPEDDLAANLRVLFEADVQYLGGGDPEHLGSLVAAVAHVRFAQGFPLASMEQAISTMRGVVLPLVIREFSSEPERLSEAVSAILRTEELSSVRLAEVYQEVTAAKILAAQDNVLRAEHEKVVFCREMVRVATHEKLIVCDHGDIPAPHHVEPVEIANPRDVRRARHMAAQIAEDAGWDANRSYALQLCIGEAGTNAIRHAGTATFHVWREDDDSVSFRLADHGSGIDLCRIPIALRPGFSTGSSLGMGFTLMLELADRIHLATDHTGTTLLLTVKRAR